MLDSVKISRRQSEIREALAKLVAKPELTDDETRSMTDMETEYQKNEARYRAALVTEDTERREAAEDLETRSDKEWAKIMANFEMRQVARALGEDGRPLTGQTAEIVEEMRSKGSYQGIPVPWEALELRAGETVASGTPDPIRTMPTIDRIFAQSVATRMGASMISIDNGEVEYPVTTSNVTAGWADGELADVAGPTVYATTDRPLVPNHNLGITMTVSRRAMKQTGTALEQAIRRDMNGTIGQELDKAVFLGTAANGQPAGVIADASNYGITETAIDAAPTWAVFRAAMVRFMTANAISSPDQVNILMRPEVWDDLDDTIFDAGSGLTELDRLGRNVPANRRNISSNALAAPAGDPLVTSALLTCSPGGVPPAFVGMWGGIDLVRDPYSLAPSGALALTALVTMDVTISRTAQLEILTDIQRAA
jgi:HK97 family phage major capsid protein